MGPIELKPDRWQMLIAIASLLSVLAVGAGLIVTNNYNRDRQRLTRQGQITDRFTKAVEQLGQPGPQKIDVRLGAIYALQRIMRDSEDDQPAVVDILSAFVRVHAPAPRRDRNNSFTENPSPRPVDIQAALTVLVRRDQGRDGEGHVDLSQTNLARANLIGAHLSGADLAGAYLAGAQLRGAHLSGADLAGAHLSGADLFGASLSGASLSGANLSGASLSGASLFGADLWLADLRRANLYQADLSKATLFHANLIGANLPGANVASEQLRCTYVDGDTELPAQVGRPLMNAPDKDPRCV